MNSNDRERLSLIARIILLAVIITLVVMMSECRRTHAAAVPAELVPGHHAIVIIQGEMPLAYTELVSRQIIGEKKGVDKVNKTDGKTKHTDAELLAEVMYYENWNTDPDHLAAYYTGAVVMNRVNSEEWPDTVKDVLYQSGQYSTTRKFFTKELPGECLEMAKRIIEEGTPDVPETVVFQSMRKQGSGVWQKVNTDFFCYQ